ncbi:MAG: iron complex outermembrane receptor protein, partial [Pirellulaceae bacterium]
DPSECDRWGLEVSARIVDDQNQYAESLGEQGTPGFTTVDLRGYLNATDQLTFNFGVENLTNKYYQEHLDPHGRELRFSPFLPALPLLSSGTVYRPGINFYFSSEYIY